MLYLFPGERRLLADQSLSGTDHQTYFLRSEPKRGQARACPRYPARPAAAARTQLAGTGPPDAIRLCQADRAYNARFMKILLGPPFACRMV
jgi:hypothetical protein